MAKIRDEKVYAQTYPKVEPRAKNINSKRIKSAIITDSLVISKEKSVNLPICGKAKSAKKKLISITVVLQSQKLNHIVLHPQMLYHSEISVIYLLTNRARFCGPKQGDFLLIVNKGKKKSAFCRRSCKRGR